MSRPRLQIIRGIPGSGKSTLAHSTYPHLMIFEFDKLCISGGEYTFDASVNVCMQSQLFRMVSEYLALGADAVVCGVFCGHSESLRDYVETALAAGYEVWIKTCTGEWPNKHMCGGADLREMKETFVTDEGLAREPWMKGVKFGLMPWTWEVSQATKDYASGNEEAAS